ncbi:MBL fold metallo-hydrolase [Arenibaculum pallidiluteum]|uniref:MBL fold metallo-hydrolase n=1 Tax=Arenibaculum pallidiluteum TaxID=2812559 RepID=UPI001A957614|nr:MBL fold metallo-hydrolase [Arenibaculum pallidiluteum]
MQVTVLGCGSSGGVPLVGGDWGACDPSEPRNRRMRPSILIEENGFAVLVDTGPDLREQLLRAGVGRLDAVLYTHWHADHTHGIDDLRNICVRMGRAIDVYGDAETMESLGQRFSYAFRPLDAGQGIYRPALVPHVIERPFELGPLNVVPFVQDHGWARSLGFRIGRFAYSTDVVRLDEAAFAALEGIDTWIVDCVRIAPPHPVHAHLPVTLSWIERVRPRRAYLTHMNQAMDYRAVLAQLPPGVEPAHDGLVLDIPL